jgi:transcriptional regulator NrdR family protein
MVCIYCSNDTKVINSRYKARNLLVWRRRVCTHCKAATTTYESYDLSIALVVKKRSNALQAFHRDKILISIYKSIEHKKNASIDAGYLTQTVIQKLLKTPNIGSFIKTSDISRVTSLVLKRYDAASSIKYLSFQEPMQTTRDIKNKLK